MFLPPYLLAMDSFDIHIALMAQDAAEALIALGWPVSPAGPDLERWVIGDIELTDDELISLATRRGIRPLDDPMH